MPDLLTAFAIIAAVLVLSGLTSGLVERAPLSFPIIFLGLGFALGQHGLHVIEVEARSPILEVVAVLTLSLVLFLDAVRLPLSEVRREWLIPALVLGPGTLLIIALVAAAAAFLLGLPPIFALLVGAMLASTDPVVLRDIIRDPRLPRSVRHTLKVEAGTNDVVVLPIILVLLAVASGRASGVAEWVVLLARLLLLGPLVGFIVGGLGSWLFGRIDALLGIRQEYQSVYGIGLVLAAYAISTSLGGDGFLASFAAGLAVTVLNQKLCDCFLEYGDTTAEMAMLLAFVLFGAVLSDLLGTVAFGPALLLALLAIFLVRPLVLGLMLARARLSGTARAFIGWFGPRGLNSLLLALLAIQADLPGAEQLLAIVGAVVVVSVSVHGVSATPLANWYARKVGRETLAEEREGTLGGLFRDIDAPVPRLSPEELARRLAEPDSPLILDVRSRSSYEREPVQIPSSVRVPPDHVVEWAARQPRGRRVVTYCT